MNLWLLFILCALATFRLSHMLAKEKGAARIAKKVRTAPPPKSLWREGLSCPLCLSVWFSALITAYLAIIDAAPGELLPIWWIACSGASILYNRWFTS